MKKISIFLFMLPFAASAQQRAPTPVEEAQMQIKLNSMACKSVGQDDGGVTCDAAKFLNAKLMTKIEELSKPPAPAPVEKPKGK